MNRNLEIMTDMVIFLNYFTISLKPLLNVNVLKNKYIGSLF